MAAGRVLSHPRYRPAVSGSQHYRSSATPSVTAAVLSLPSPISATWSLASPGEGGKGWGEAAAAATANIHT